MYNISYRNMNQWLNTFFLYLKHVLVICKAKMGIETHLSETQSVRVALHFLTSVLFTKIRATGNSKILIQVFAIHLVGHGKKIAYCRL